VCKTAGVVKTLVNKTRFLSGVFLSILLCFSIVVSVNAEAEMWGQTYGGAGDDVGRSLVVTSDGGYVIAGYTSSFGAGGLDFWVVKTDEDGVAPVVPEAAWVVLPLLLTATVAIIISKKKPNTRP
jgi:hypothetical protein